MKALWSTLLCAGLLVLSPKAVAQEEEQGALLVIMDVSGSMDEDDDAGGTRIEGARDAVSDLVEAVPGGTRVGLRVYGGQFDNSQKDEGCRDTRLAVPIGSVDSTGPMITSEIQDATPLGFTPIGFSLQEAADDFGEEANRSIVLVSDGEDTCGDPNPCDVAEQLSEDGVDVRVDTIGLAIGDNQEARGQLECIAEATGGTFVEATDADELTDRLSRLSTRAIEGWSAEGEEVDGGAIQTEATAVEPGTIYLDDVVTGEARWYSFPVAEGDDITVTLSEDGTLEYGCCVELKLTRPGETRHFTFENGFTDGVPKIYRTGTPEDGAQQSGDYYLSVVLDDDDSEGQPLEYQMEVVVEGDSTTTEPTATGTATEPAEADEASAEPADGEPTGDDEAAAAADAQEADGGNGLLIALIVVLGVAVVGLAGGLLYVLRRLNRESS